MATPCTETAAAPATVPESVPLYASYPPWRVTSAPSVVSSTTRPAAALLFWHPSVATLARSLLARCTETGACGSESVLEPGEATWRTFPDGWPNISFAERATLEHRNVVFVASLHHPSVVVEQQAFLVALARQRLHSLHIIVPYYGPGTMERVSRDNEVASAEPFFKLLTSSLPPLTGGAPTVTVMDAHALCTRFYAADTCTVVDTSAFSLALAWARKNKATVVFPDDGAAKRFGPLFAGGGVPTLTCAKKRGAGDERHLTFADATPTEGQECALIVDDLCQSGGTVAENAKLLKPFFKRVSAFCVHAVFPGESWRRFAYGGRDHGLLHDFFVCNTNPAVTDVIAAGLCERAMHARREIFEVWDVAPLLAAQLERDLRAGVTLQRLSHAQLVAATIAPRPAPGQRPILMLLTRSCVKRAATRAAASAVGYNPAPAPRPTPEELARWKKIEAGPCGWYNTDLSSGSYGDVSARVLRWLERDTKSGVAEQPLSAAETLRGAETRLTQAWSSTPCEPERAANVDVIAVAIESGLWERNGVLQDAAYVVVERRGPWPARATVLSAAHRVDVVADALYAQAWARVREAAGALTLGQALHALDATAYPDAKAWFDRERQLRDAVTRALMLV